MIIFRYFVILAFKHLTGVVSLRITFNNSRNIPRGRPLSLLYCGMLSCLPLSIKELITDPKPETIYMSLEEEVLKHNMQSSHSRFTLLMEDESLGDRTPSRFLRRLRALSDSPFNTSTLLKHIVSLRLPLNVQTILATGLETNSTDQVASMTAKILEFSGCSTSLKSEPEASATTSKSDTASSSDFLQKIGFSH